MSLDLATIAKEHYHGNVITPHPSTVVSSHLTKVMKGWGFPYEQWPQDLKDQYDYNPAAAKKLLAEAGFPHGFKTNIIVDTASDMKLFEIIKKSFAAIGVEMEVRPMESNACTEFVGARKHDQLVYRQYGPLGHCYAPFQAITRFHSASKVNWTITNDPVIDGYYPAAIAASTEDEFKLIMKNMCERVARQHFAISLLQPYEYMLCQPWAKGYHGQIHSVWMGTGGPSRLSLYGARFWIDHDLKKKMGKE
jgi:ABC-type transport system substrate-binding protein